jgi:hypothetical protein
MTVVGFNKRPGGALVWADSELYLRGAPFGSKTKLIATESGLVGIGTGNNWILEAYDGAVARSGTFRDAVSILPAILRGKAAQRRQAHRDDEPYRQVTTCALVGWSNGETRGVIFLEERRFDPIEADAWSSPHVDARPSTAAEALAVAQAQMKIFRRQIPGASGLTLTVARVGAGKIIKTSVPLLIGNELAPSASPALAESPAALAAYASQSPAHQAAALRDAEVRRRLGY